jgi:hypothetical protein
MVAGAAATNALGLACFYATAHAHHTPAGHSMALADPAYVLDSIGFTLMLPGIFFAAIAFVCARALMCSDESARVIWYATGYVLNLIVAWRVGTALAATART